MGFEIFRAGADRVASGSGGEDRGDSYRSGCRQCGFGRKLFISRRLYDEHECPAQSADGNAPKPSEEPERGFDSPEPASAPAELFEGLRQRLREDVVGHDEAVDRFALAGLQHVFGPGGQRLLLIGPTGVGKSTLCRALADALDLPFVAIDVGELAETNWHGFDMRDALQALRRRADGDEEVMRKAVVVLDEIDKVGSGSYEGTGREYRRGKQESLLGLLGGDVDLHYGPNRDEGRWSWRSDEALIVGAGVFDRLPPGRPSAGDLVEWGLMPEVVGRLGSILRLEPLSAGELEEVLWRQLRDIDATYRALGYRLVVDPSALEEVAELVTSRAGGVDPRSGATLLRDAGERGLVRLLARAASPGSAFDLTTAELELPTDKSGDGRIGFR